MATIQIPVTALDEKCISCKAIELEKTDYYANLDKVFTVYQCKNLHLCQYIKNRIIRGGVSPFKEEEKIDDDHD